MRILHSDPQELPALRSYPRDVVCHRGCDHKTTGNGGCGSKRLRQRPQTPVLVVSNDVGLNCCGNARHSQLLQMRTKGKHGLHIRRLETHPIGQRQLAQVRKRGQEALRHACRNGLCDIPPHPIDDVSPRCFNTSPARLARKAQGELVQGSASAEVCRWNVPAIWECLG